jgi:hypothetical protein
MITVTVRWNPVTHDALGNPLVAPVTYDLWRKNGQLVTSGLTATSYSWLNRLPRGRICFYVEAVSGGRSSAPSNTACVQLP